MKSANSSSIVALVFLPNFAVLLFVGTHCELCYSQEQRVVSPNEQRVRDEGLKRMANLDRIKDRIELDRRGFFRIDEFFRELEAGVAGFKLRNDNRLYALVYAESVRNEIHLGPEQSKELESLARQLSTRADDSLARYSKSGAIEEIDQFELANAKFEEKLSNQLTIEQQDRLKTIQLRNVILAEGLPQFLEREASNLGLSAQSVEEINSEIQQLGLSLCREANRQFVREINEILPGYFGEFQEDDWAYLPLLPLEAFLVVADNPEPVSRAAANSVTRFGIDLQAGDWVFSGPTFQRKSSGKLVVSAISIVAEIPKLPLISFRTHVGAELSPEQRLEMQEILTEIERRNVASRNGPSNDQENFIANKKSLELIKGLLLPVQLRPVSNYAKLHSLFTLGPVFIYEQVGSSKFPPRAEFDEKLKTAKLRISELIGKNMIRVANEFVKLVNEKSDLDSTLLRPELIISPDRSNYERLFRPILSLESHRIGN